MNRKQRPHTCIIAEAGVNHNGDISIAKELVDVAVKAQADAIKFQTYKTEEIVTRYGEKAQHQQRAKEKTQYEMLKHLELSYDDFYELKQYCDTKHIEFLSTPYDSESVAFLKPLVQRFKVPSADIVNKPLLSAVAQSKKQILLSTGMATDKEIQQAVTFLHNQGCKDLVLFHCTSSYPSPYDEVNLAVLSTLKQRFGAPVGYSDHTPGFVIPIMAVSLGATMIEKHFTLNRDMEGPDHFASLEPDELRQMVTAIRQVEQAFGSPGKQITKSEEKNRYYLRRSIHAIRDINKDQLIQESDIGLLRPNDGASPWDVDTIIGKTAKRTIKKYQPIKEDDV